MPDTALVAPAAARALAPWPRSSLEIAKVLIGLPTVSSDSNLNLIEWVQGYLQAHGVASRLSWDISGRKANLLATFGDARQGGLLLSGHSDVVPVTGQSWQSDPFVPRVNEGRLYGRGSADMKGFIACALALAPLLTSQARQFPVHLALSFDEEIGCAGARRLIDDMRLAGTRPHACIVGEPTEMALGIGHKGRRELTCRVRGKAVHSSRPGDGANAIHYAARLQLFIADLAERLQLDASGAEGEGFDVPYTTLQTCTVTGGQAANIVPGECEFSFEIRPLPGTDTNGLQARIEGFAYDSLRATMRREFADAAFEFTCVSDTPGLNDSGQRDLVEWLAQTGHTQGQRKLAYTTEAGLFQQAGIPTVICGPGSIRQAHAANEYVDLEQLQRCDAFLRAVVTRPMPF